MSDPIYRSEINAFERTSLRHVSGLTEIDEGTALGKIQKKLERQLLTPQDKFIKTVESFIYEYGDVFDISPNDSQILIDKINLIKDIQYKNPICYVLGYMATNGGIEFNKKTVKKIFNNLDKIKIKNVDVIKYGRFWLDFKNEF
jgi:hypothetical protein